MRSLIAAFSIGFIANMGIAETPCGGSFDGFMRDVKKEARSLGYSRNAVDQFFASATKCSKLIVPKECFKCRS
jgi:hypothetical protein